MPRLKARQAVTQPLDKPYRFIPLTQDQKAIVDSEDFEWLSQWHWYAHWASNTKSFYAATGKHGMPMHKMLLQCGPGKTVDHINHDTLDNRRKNLREATREEQACNRRQKSDNKSGFKGVYWRKDERKWRVAIRVNGHRTTIGQFDSLEKAAKAYDEAAKKFHGKFAHLNFPKGNQS